MKKLIRSWTLFDWAAQPFYTVIVTFVFAPYFSSVIIGDEVRGQSLLGLMDTIAGLGLAVCAPLAAAYADYGGHRKRWIIVMSIFFVLFCSGLYFEWSVGWVMVCFVASYFFIEMLLVFTNAYLPEITDDDNVGQVSNVAWGLGYLGGLVVLILYLVLIMPVPGSDRTAAGLTPIFGEKFGGSTGPVSALWYLVFMIPFFLYMPDTKPQGDPSKAVSNAMKSLKSTFVIAFKDKKLFWFFLMSLVSRDALGGIFIFGSLYASGVLGWTLFGIALFGIVLNITGVVGGLVGAKLVSKRDTSYVIKVSLWLFTIISFVALSTNQTHLVFFPVPQGPMPAGLAAFVGPTTGNIWPHIAFFVCGMFIGAGAGSLQGSLRGLVGPLTKGKIAPGEAFGLFGMLGRATAFIAPMLVGAVTAMSQNVQYGAWPIVGLFIVSLIIYYKFENIKE